MKFQRKIRNTHIKSQSQQNSLRSTPFAITTEPKETSTQIVNKQWSRRRTSYTRIPNRYSLNVFQWRFHFLLISNFKLEQMWLEWPILKYALFVSISQVCNSVVCGWVAESVTFNRRHDSFLQIYECCLFVVLVCRVCRAHLSRSIVRQGPSFSMNAVNKYVYRKPAYYESSSSVCVCVCIWTVCGSDCLCFNQFHLNVGWFNERVYRSSSNIGSSFVSWSSFSFSTSSNSLYFDWNIAKFLVFNRSIDWKSEVLYSLWEANEVSVKRDRIDYSTDFCTQFQECVCIIFVLIVTLYKSYWRSR